MMEYAISAIWIGLELLCSILFNGAFLSKKGFKKQYFIVIIIVWMLACIYTSIQINQFMKQILLVTIYTGLSIVLYHGTCVVHVCLAVVCYVFIAAIDAITINSMCYFIGISYNTIVWRKLSYFTLTTADKLIAVFLAWLLNRFRKKGSLGNQHSRWMQLSILFPSVSATMLVVLFYTSPHDKDVSLGIVVFSGILMIANVAMLYVISSIEKATEREHDLRMLQQQIFIQTENYTALRKNYTVQRKSTHEFERHIQVIRDLLDRKEFETAQDYVRQLQSDRTLKVFSITSNNPVIDAVLNQKHQVAQESSIKMCVKVNNLSDVTIKTNEIVVLLSNLLDNAIEACMKIEQNREIVCSILMEDSIYISIRNTSPPVSIIRGEIPTTKQDATDHGYGLQAVKFILNQSNAEYTFAYSDGWFHFVAEIPL